MPYYPNHKESDFISELRQTYSEEQSPLTPGSLSQDILAWTKGVVPEERQSTSFSSTSSFGLDDIAFDRLSQADSYVELPEQEAGSASQLGSAGSPPPLETASSSSISPILDEPAMARDILPRDMRQESAAHFVLTNPGFASLPPSAISNPPFHPYGLGPMEHYPDCPSYLHQRAMLHNQQSHHLGMMRARVAPPVPASISPAMLTAHYNYNALQLPAHSAHNSQYQMPADATIAPPPGSDSNEQAIFHGVGEPDILRSSESLGGVTPVPPDAQSTDRSETFTAGTNNLPAKTEPPASPSASDIASPSTVDGGQGRKSELYNAPPREDGLYHCYYESTEGCIHKPTNLKCNYDKYIDSHLKPYRCTKPGCEELQFSSTACRLRHEREAHGSHGHGHKPFPCKFEHCERHENGFPRHWNCIDHMKRVHGYVPDASEEEGNSPAETVIDNTSQAGSSKSNKKRARKDSQGPASSKKLKMSAASTTADRAKANPVSQPSAIADVDEQSRLHAEWVAIRRDLPSLASSLQGPNDNTTLQKLRESLDRLTGIHLAVSG